MTFDPNLVMWHKWDGQPVLVTKSGQNRSSHVGEEEEEEEEERNRTEEIHSRRLWLCNQRRMALRIDESQLGAFCPLAIMFCYLEFKLRYFTNLKLFSIRVKELFEPIVLRKKCRRVLLFSKTFSWEIDFWVTLDDFTVKTQNWEGKSVFNWKSIK